MKNEKDPLDSVSHINIDFSKKPPVFSVHSKKGEIFFSANVGDTDIKEIQSFIKDILRNKCKSP